VPGGPPGQCASSLHLNTKSGLDVDDQKRGSKTGKSPLNESRFFMSLPSLQDMPTGQSKHLLLPFGKYQASGQMQPETSLTPKNGVVLPARTSSQAMHSLMPSEGWKAPIPHKTHEDMPISLENLPEGHASQAV